MVGIKVSRLDNSCVWLLERDVLLRLSTLLDVSGSNWKNPPTVLFKGSLSLNMTLSGQTVSVPSLESSVFCLFPCERGLVKMREYHYSYCSM